MMVLFVQAPAGLDLKSVGNKSRGMESHPSTKGRENETASKTADKTSKTT